MQDAIEANLFSFPLFHRWSRTVDAYDGPDLLWTLTDVPHPLFNSVLRARLEDVDAAVDAVIAPGMPRLWWVDAAEVGERLLERGFVFAGENVGMARRVVPRRREGTESPAAGDPALKRGMTRVSDAELRIWNSVPNGSEERYQFYAETQHLFRHYVAFVDGVPAGTASLFPSEGVAGIYNVYTRPEFRRRGIGEALTRAALDDARELGLDVAVLQASPMSASLYRRMGFVGYCSFGHYVWPA